MVFEKYLIKITDTRIPDIIYATFPDITNNSELLNKIYKAWRLGNDSEYAQIYFAKHDVGIILTKLTNYRVITDKKVIQVTLSNGFRCYIPLNLFGNVDVDTLLEYLKLPMQITVKHVGGVLVASEVKLPTLQTSEDIAREIVEEIGYVNALLVSLGIYPKKEMIFLFLPRLMGLLRGFRASYEKTAYYPIHVLQFTAPNSGKTAFSIRVAEALNYEYMGGELPSLTRLVYDARSGAIGSVGLRDGIILDEFDKKTANDVMKLVTDLRALLTGMEQGVWSRSVGSKGIEIRKFVNFYFYGNIPPYLKGETTREKIINFYNVSGVDALVDRITVVDVWETHINIANYLIYRIIPNYIFRGIISLILKELRPLELEVEIGKGRIERHAMNIKSILHALGIRLGDSTIAQIAEGKASFDVLNRTNPEDWFKDNVFKDYEKLKLIREKIKSS